MGTTQNRYETFIIVLAALFNSVAGIVVDLYAPCLPEIGNELHISSVVMQNTISASIIGYACGQLFFGILCDWKGRKLSIIIGLVLFVIASSLAVGANSLTALLTARILQGFAAGACQVVARAALIDEVKGHRFTIAVVYLSTAFALGLILGPYVGAVVQHSLSWRWNFVIYAIYSFILLVIASIWMRESLAKENNRSPSETFTNYKVILANKQFISSFIQLGSCFIAFTMWNQVGPFIIKHSLNKSEVYFGKTALLAGLSYLAGTFLNRFLISKSSMNWRLNLGTIIFVSGITILLMQPSFIPLRLVIGLMLITFAQGITFPNVLSHAMAIFPKMAGLSASLQGAGMLLIGFIGLSLISFIHIDSGMTLGIIYLMIFMISITSRLISYK